MYGAFWNKKIQSSSKKALKSLQLKFLRNQVTTAYDNCKYYRKRMNEAGMEPSAIRTLEDIHKLPFTTREELETHFEDILTVPFSKVATVRMTSGTTGHPMKIAHSYADIESIAEASARKLTYHGVTYKDRVQVTAAYGLAQGAWSVHWGAEKIRASIIPVGPGDTERQIRIIKQLKSTVLYGATNFHLRLLEVAKSLNEDLTINSLRVGICVAEKPTQNQIKEFKSGFGYEKVAIDYGATEFPGFSVNCNNYVNAHHVWADRYLIEIVDPQTHEPLGENERGELVITSLQREAFPLIRYLSRDITSMEDFQECSCGMCHPKVSADIDREDFMIKIRGVAVFPRHIETILGESPLLTGNCQVVVDKRTPRQQMLLKVETAKQLSNGKRVSLKSQIIEEVKNRVGVTIDDLTFVPKRTFEGKYAKTVTVR